MKKRNKPILLATFLVVLVAAAVAMNLDLQPKSQAQIAHEEQEKIAAQAKLENNDLGEKRVGEDNSKAAAEAAAAVSGVKKAPQDLAVTRPGAPSSIKKVQMAPIKPKPTSSMTAGQWYSKESGYKGGQ
jgi:hypothetical protein